MTEQIIPRELPDIFDANLDMAEELTSAVDEIPEYCEEDDAIFWDNRIFPV